MSRKALLDSDKLERQSSRYFVFGLAVLAALLVGLGVWGASVELAGAVIANGGVVVDSNVKKVQHPTGGVIGSLHVIEGQAVRAGDLLIRLDETVTRANLEIILNQLDETAVRRARLLAEDHGSETISYPSDLMARRDEAVLAEIMQSERSLFDHRRIAREGLKSQLRERIEQLEKEIEGLHAQLTARRQEHKFAKAELGGLEQLEGKNLVSTPRITSARRTVAQLEGDMAQVQSSTAQAKGKIAEIELQIMQLDQDLRTEVGKELRELQAKYAELRERRVAAEDQLKRIDIRAPQSGIVHQLAVHTVGGVVSPSEPLMLIVPSADRLVLEARVAPQDIDQIKLGQLAHIRFSAFNQRTTPDVTAVVSRVSADLVVEATQPMRPQQAQPAHYNVRLDLAPTALKKLGDLRLIPGMPAEVHIATENRSALSYFTKPLMDQFTRAFRER